MKNQQNMNLKNHIKENEKRQGALKILTKAYTNYGKLTKANTIYGHPCCMALSWPAK